MVMTLQNGMPWWYFQKHGGALDGTRLMSLDPSGVLTSTFHANRIIGCAVFVAADVPEPGVVRHIGSNRLPMGEIDGTLSDRVRAVEASFVKAGLQASAVSDIRTEIWWKALGNLAVNPISAISNATMIEILRFPETRALVLKMMQEAREIAAKLGISFPQTLEQRLESAESVGAHKTSMLQDLGERAPPGDRGADGSGVGDGEAHRYAGAHHRGRVRAHEIARPNAAPLGRLAARLSASPARNPRDVTQATSIIDRR